MSCVLSFWNHICCFKNILWAFGMISSNMCSPHQLLQILWRAFLLFHPCSSSPATGESPSLSGCQWRWESAFITETPLLCYSVAAAASQAASTFCLRRTQKCFYLKKICLCSRSKLKFAQGIPSDTIALVNAFKVTCLMPCHVIVYVHICHICLRVFVFYF